MSNSFNFPRVLICAPASGSGKTLITCALLRILKRKGYRPVSYKCGPDYIDPMFHKKVLGIPSRNLDLFLAGEDGIKKALRRGDEDQNDFGVMEGVMGYFDGFGGTSSDGSSYDISRLSETPSILVVNCRGMSVSAAAMVKGFCDYGNGRIRGIILNNISPMIAGEVSDLIYRETNIPVIGFLPALKDIKLESRHLGLIMPSEIPQLLEMIDRVSDALMQNLDFHKLLDIAKEAGELENPPEDKSIPDQNKKVKVGIARDEAFCFYYEDNLELLEKMGAELVPFSPIHDKEIPQDVSRLIFGGGYPELFAEALSDNYSMRESIRKAAAEGMPVLAECGGFLYLQEKLCNTDGKSFDMVGAIPGSSHMTGKLTHFGYVNVTAQKDNPYLADTIRAHEFHYYDTTDNGDVCLIKKAFGKRSWEGYHSRNRIFAGFAHLYYPSDKKFVERFLEC